MVPLEPDLSGIERRACAQQLRRLLARALSQWQHNDCATHGVRLSELGCKMLCKLRDDAGMDDARDADGLPGPRLEHERLTT